MDKDLLRLVIIAAGCAVFLLVLLSGLWQGRKSKRGIKLYGNKNPLDNIDDSLVVNMSEDEFDIVPLKAGSNAVEDDAFDENEHFLGAETEAVGFDRMDTVNFAVDDETSHIWDDEVHEAETSAPLQASADALVTQKPALPELVKFSLIATTDVGFNGDELVSVLKSAGLTYGSLKIFERLDEQNQVDFAVGSMVSPGTFPDQDLDLFFCPGITFFMQPAVVDDPLAVFDELIALIFLLARQLNGEILDEHRQSLAEETTDLIRQRLSV